MYHWLATHFMAQATIIICGTAISAGGIRASWHEHKRRQRIQERLALICHRYGGNT